MAKRKRSQTLRSDKAARKLAKKRAKQAKLATLATVDATDVPQSQTIAVDKAVSIDQAQPGDDCEGKHGNEVPTAWNMRIEDIGVGDFVVLEVEYDKPHAKGISVAQVTRKMMAMSHFTDIWRA